jgi:hypothetical protein
LQYSFTRGNLFLRFPAIRFDLWGISSISVNKNYHPVKRFNHEGKGISSPSKIEPQSKHHLRGIRDINCGIPLPVVSFPAFSPDSEREIHQEKKEVL